jgi:hypothetical protein
LIQEQLCRFLLDEVINPRREIYAGLSSIIVTTATEKETSRAKKEAFGSKDQTFGSKKLTLLTFHPMYIINLNFNPKFQYTQYANVSYYFQSSSISRFEK